MNIKRQILVALALLASGALQQMQAQDSIRFTYCNGWHNPTSFSTNAGLAGETRWEGLITPNRNSVPGHWQTGVPWIENNDFTLVEAADLATTVSTSSPCPTSGAQGSNYSQSRNINNASDYNNRFVIKGRGLAPETNNHLPYTPATYAAGSGTQYTLDSSYTTSIRLGNYCGGHEGEALRYTMKVAPQNALLTLWYSVSLEPGSHGWTGTAYAQGSTNSSSEFVVYVEVYNQTTNTWTRLGGEEMFYNVVAPMSASNGDGMYQGMGANAYMPWKKVMIDLSQYVSRRVRVVMATGDCGNPNTVHYGMCYIAGDCAPMQLSASGCAAGETDFVSQLTAPDGMSTYQWYRSNTGILTGADRDNLNNYTLIEGATGSVYNATLADFQVRGTGPDGRPTTEIVANTTILCKVQSVMNVRAHNAVTHPLFINASLPVNVSNTKPTIILDTIDVDCNGNITLQDVSRAFCTPDPDLDLVDPSFTQWKFYDSRAPIAGETPVATATGPTATAHFDTPGHHRVNVTVASYRTDENGDRTCWNRKDYVIRTMSTPVVSVAPYNEVVCAGEMVSVVNTTTYELEGRTYTVGNGLASGNGTSTFTYPNIDTHQDTTVVAPSTLWQFAYDESFDFSLETYFSNIYWEHEDSLGNMVRHYCPATGTFHVDVEQWPEPTIAGDLVVCAGRPADLTASTDDPTCTYTWYQDNADGAPAGTGTVLHRDQIYSDETYLVHAETPHGCDGWDTATLILLAPSLNYHTKYLRNEICEGDEARLWGSEALTYKWYSQPDDMSMWDQDRNDTIVVTPSQTTLYKLVGYGSDPQICYADTLYQEIIVHPYPKLQVRLTPDYIDSDNPSVQFSDISEYGTGSRWIFHGEDTSYIRSVVWNFQDKLSEEIVNVDLRSYNPLSCYRDTNFWVPVDVFSVWYPNAFTPRLESNNTFHVHTANHLDDYELTIYDRRGVQVFHTTNPEEAWDGTVNGNLLPQGIYTWRATYRRSGVARLINKTGNVLLIL